MSDLFVHVPTAIAPLLYANPKGLPVKAATASSDLPGRLHFDKNRNY
jgi:hypothetical protein